MDGRRLKIKDKLQDINTKKLLLVGIGFFLLVIFAVSIFFFRTELLLIIPNFYQNDKYNELMAKKNDLIDKNIVLLSDNKQINKEIETLEDKPGQEKVKIDKNRDMLDNLKKLQKNIEKMLDYDKEMKNLRLPDEISKYIDLNMQLDEIRKETIEVHIDYKEAQIFMNRFNVRRDEFDQCLVNINWDQEDDKIADNLVSCRDIVDEMKSQVANMEKEYDVELKDLSKYTSNLYQQWDASIKYYRAVYNDNFNKANEHDSVFVEKKRALNEMDVEIFNEFDKKVTNKYKKSFEEKMQKEDEQEVEVKKWYEEHIE